MVPKDIERALPLLEALAIQGAVPSRDCDTRWLQTIGVLQDSTHIDWLVPATRWIEDALPAADELDLLRKTAIRDPRYRAHLDLCLCAVLHAVGKAERWLRLEELLLGSCLAFAPRLVQLVEWQQSRLNVKATFMEETAWRDADALVCGELLSHFRHWDRTLWGSSGSSSELFPLLCDLYVPLIEQPVHVDLVSHRSPQMTDPAGALLKRLINAARSKEGIRFHVADEGALQQLLFWGLPVRKLEHPSAQAQLHLIGCVTVTDSPDSTRVPDDLSPLSYVLPDFVETSAILVRQEDPLRDGCDLWQMSENLVKDWHVFFSIHPGEEIWPALSAGSVPPWAPIPGMEAIKEVGRPRSLSPEADEALLQLGHHPLYGFFLQLLLLEALDRELGDETLVLAPPLDQRIEQIEAATRVVYRPRVLQEGHATMLSFPSYELGLLDDVFTSLARSMSIRGIAYPYVFHEKGPWARCLQLFRTAELVVGRHDRWSLSAHVLDRLHGGGLMKAVIRRGHPIRERLHQEFHVLWQSQKGSLQIREAAYE